MPSSKTGFLLTAGEKGKEKKAVSFVFTTRVTPLNFRLNTFKHSK